MFFCYAFKALCLRIYVLGVSVFVPRFRERLASRCQHDRESVRRVSRESSARIPTIFLHVLRPVTIVLAATARIFVKFSVSSCSAQPSEPRVYSEPSFNTSSTTPLPQSHLVTLGFRMRMDHKLQMRIEETIRVSCARLKKTTVHISFSFITA